MTINKIVNKKSTNDIYKKLDDLNNKMGKINTLDVYFKKIMQMEKRLGMSNVRNQTKIDENAQNIEKRLFLFIKETIMAEMGPIQHTFSELRNQMYDIENRMETLEKSMSEFERKKEKSESDQKKEVQPIIYQEFKVDKFFVDKYEQVNNLGNVGIRDLSGHLNIGAAYKEDSIPQDVKREWNEKFKKMKELKDKHKQDNDESQM